MTSGNPIIHDQVEFGGGKSPNEMSQPFPNKAAGIEFDIGDRKFQKQIDRYLQRRRSRVISKEIYNYEEGIAAQDVREHPRLFLPKLGIALAEDAIRRAGSQEVIYHGTRFGKQIIEHDAIRYGRVGFKNVSLSNDAYVAAYWATLGRGEPDVEKGAIVILNRPLLQAKYSLRQLRGEFGDIEENVWFQDIERASDVVVDIAWL